MFYYKKWAIVIPMANEEQDFKPFIEMLNFVIDELNPGSVYFIIDKASTDKTLELSQALSAKDSRYVTVWAPENKNVVDAYVKGLRVAYEAGHDIIIEMDAGLSHDPRAIPMFLRVLNEGNECAFGSSFGSRPYGDVRGDLGGGSERPLESSGSEPAAVLSQRDSWLEAI